MNQSKLEVVKPVMARVNIDILRISELKWIGMGEFNSSILFSSLIPKMSMFSLAISCLTASNLPWFTDLTLQVPVQYYSLQHWTLLSPPDTSTAGRSFRFGSASSFLLELFSLLIFSSILGTYWPGKFIFQHHISLPFHTIRGGSQSKSTEVFYHSLL